ncbi:Plasmid stability protein StbC [Pseudomonas meliae]|uniref:Plasmid stability protein StbC n=1 Tax=Pseudomonas meliae TaxID=86176 RepID=A0A0P9TZ31_9PSED|nr:Plasmid stability protein StbC [Pseudomonas meliae]
MVSKVYSDTTDGKTGNYQVANVNVRNLPDEVHRAIRIQAALHGRSTEAEIRDILDAGGETRGTCETWLVPGFYCP